MRGPHLFALLGLVLGIATSFGCNLCKDEVVDKISAQEGGLTAVTRTRDCGATTAETMWVSLQADANEKDVSANHVFVLKHIHRVHVSWKDKATVLIDCRDCTADEVHLQVTKLGSTRIEYD